MDKQQNKYIAVAYKLYTVENGTKELVEEATAERPFQFISGFGITLDAFEAKTIGLAKDEEFSFELSKDEAYGDSDPAHILDLDREMFCINGHFDHEHIFKDAIVPLQNEDGNRFYGRVLDLNEEKVKMDLNHPLAGKTLCFEGTVLESREATNSEIEAMVKRLSGEGCGCGCGCDDCDDCDGHHDHDCDCHHDHDHHHDCHHGDHNCHCNH